MRYHLSSKHLDLTDREQDRLLAQISKLEPLVQNFPPDAVDADVTVDRHQRTQDYVVSLRLGLTSTVLVSREQAPALETATRAAVDDIMDQLGRYKARLRGEADRQRAGSELHPSDVPLEVRALVDERELYDRSLTGDAEAFNDLTRGHLPTVTKTIRRVLRQRGITDRKEQDAVIQRLLGQIIALALRDLAQKPRRMSLQGWLSYKARGVVEQELRSQEPHFGEVA